ncbi:hypothetical protein XAP412_950045 [Xanthomonas phaseoli pv. phaseoli]|uniref:Uncharacterized protein n=1 Tax=Xanthomonas campestris pv. phaseoli TaxID=317013 RepID=A0AB38E613_XANCH|nr:hypothetical protein XAP6984_980045 [Xanthomonas phaseoli pv. phaseoli]SON91623.1 hypothetical protein XAP412_950045 [Xanthomonas phaseoli pv. phaseoli]SON93033.1 hypothetical protein XAP7430_970045 [Xanthomonas phaseoli pv. phaseoli]
MCGDAMQRALLQRLPRVATREAGCCMQREAAITDLSLHVLMHRGAGAATRRLARRLHRPGIQTGSHSDLNKQAAAATCSAHRAAFRADCLVDATARFGILVHP